MVVAFFVHAWAWRFVADDAYISFRYARNLAEHGALVFNVDPLERVEGYTNFAWVSLLALAAGLGIPLERVAMGLTWASAFGGLFAVMALQRALRLRFGRDRDPSWRVADLLGAAWLVALPEYMVWSGSGLETALGGALAIGAMAAFVRGGWMAAAILAALAGLTRADALLPIAAFGLAWLVAVVGPLRARPWTRVAWGPVVRAGLVFAIPLLAHLLWRRIYYGAWLPNTWTVKAHGAALRETHGVPYVQAWVSGVGLVGAVVLVPALRLRHLLPLVPAVCVLGYGVSVGGDFMAYGRFYIVATMLLAVALGWMLDDIGQRSKPWRWLALGLGLAAAIGTGVRAHRRWELDRSTAPGWIDGKWEGVTAMHRFAIVGLAVGRWMHDNLPADTLITVGAAGAVPYGSNLPTIDAYGLVDPHLSSMPDLRPRTGRGARPGHQLVAPPAYVRSRDPDLLCHVGHRGPKRPANPRPGSPFRDGYTWACIEPGPIEDHTSPSGSLDPGFYCCRRPIDRVVGPFGTGEERP